MIDHLRLYVPVYPVYAVERGKGSFYFEGDMLDLGLSCASRSVARCDDGTVQARDLYAPYESRTYRPSSVIIICKRRDVCKRAVYQAMAHHPLPDLKQSPWRTSYQTTPNRISSQFSQSRHRAHQTNKNTGRQFRHNERYVTIAKRQAVQKCTLARLGAI